MCIHSLLNSGESAAERTERNVAFSSFDVLLPFLRSSCTCPSFSHDRSATLSSFSFFSCSCIAAAAAAATVYDVYNLWNCFLNNTFEQLNRSTNATKTSSWYLFINYNRECARLKQSTPRALIFFSILFNCSTWFAIVSLLVVFIMTLSSTSWFDPYHVCKYAFRKFAESFQKQHKCKTKLASRNIFSMLNLNFSLSNFFLMWNLSMYWFWPGASEIKLCVLCSPKQFFNDSMSFQAIALLAIVVKLKINDLDTKQFVSWELVGKFP